MSAYGSYQNAYRRASVNTMDQGKLIVMLYDGAIRNINFALQHLKDDEVEKTKPSKMSQKTGRSGGLQEMAQLIADALPADVGNETAITLN